MNFKNEWTETVDLDGNLLFNDIENIFINNNFKNFRRLQSLCNQVSGGNRGNRGNKYLNYLFKNNKNIILDNLDKLIKHNTFGNPILYNFKFGNNILRMSDSIIPPLYLITKIKKYFNKIDNNLKIMEIGCGFGINTVIFSDLIGFSKYYMIDVPIMLKLQEKYISHFNIKNIIYINPYDNLNEINNLNEEYDFFISDFAFTEFSKKLQLYYFNTIIKKCKKGIILGRININKENINSYLNKDIYNLFLKYFKIFYEINESYSKRGKSGIIYFEKK